MMLHFLLSAARAIDEMLLLCLLGQGLLHVVSGSGRDRNPIYRLFATITQPPLAFARRWLPFPGTTPLIFAILMAMWFGLALLKKFI